MVHQPLHLKREPLSLAGALDQGKAGKESCEGEQEKALAILARAFFLFYLSDAPLQHSLRNQL